MSTILITGCSTGIGFASAILLARQGHTVYATMRNPAGSPSLANLAQRENLSLTVLSLDVDDDDSVKTAVARVLAEAGQLDVLVNNAGIGPTGSVEETPLATYQAVMQTNYFGAVRCIQAVLPGMRARGNGLIINVSSVAGEIFSPCFGPYCATKAALEALSESLAGEVGQFGIRVALVQPGVIDTPLIPKAGADFAATTYPNHARLLAYLAASVSNHESPDSVAQAIGGIVSGEKTAFRNPVGLDSAPLLAWRASLSDEDWVGVGALDHESWVGGMAQMGMDVRPHWEALTQAADA